MRLQEGSNEIAGSRPISARVGQHTGFGGARREPFHSVFVWMLRYGVPGHVHMYVCMIESDRILTMLHRILVNGILFFFNISTRHIKVAVTN